MHECKIENQVVSEITTPLDSPFNDMLLCQEKTGQGGLIGAN